MRFIDKSEACISYVEPVFLFKQSAEPPITWWQGRSEGLNRHRSAFAGCPLDILCGDALNYCNPMAALATATLRLLQIAKARILCVYLNEDYKLLLIGPNV